MNGDHFPNEIPCFFMVFHTVYPRVYVCMYVCMYVYDIYIYMGISINGGTPISGWFVMDNPIK